jgi:replicative DNA helicase
MGIHGMKLISKVIEANDPKLLDRFKVEPHHFATAEEQRIARFIREYAERNRGNAPNHVEVAAQFEGFEFYPQTAETSEYLAQQVKDAWAKAEILRVIQGQAANNDPNSRANKKDGQYLSKILNERGGAELLDWLQDELQRVKIGTNVRVKVGQSIKNDTEWFLDQYRERAAGLTLRAWRSAFPTINEEIGGYLSGNMFTWYGRSGRGKSVFVLREALAAAMQGATVLFWALEMPAYEVYARAYSMLSAEKGIYTAKIAGTDYRAGFSNSDILRGQLDEKFAPLFEKFLKEELREILKGDLIVRALDDEGFSGQRVKDLEADIETVGADVVVVDPFYYMDYERNTSKTKGGDAAATSEKIRKLAGRTKTVIHVITQAEEVRDDRDEEGNRELRAPRRAEIQKTKAVLHDASNTFGIDTLDGQGIIELGKGRSGGEGAKVEVLYLPNYGIVKEASEAGAHTTDDAEFFDLDKVF